MLKHFILILGISLAAKAYGQDVKMVNFDAVQKLMERNTDTTYVINFWATWCNPCVHELPNFDRIDSIYKGKEIKIYLISIDFPKEMNSKLAPFVKKNHVKSTVWLLNDPDYNSWIDKVDTSWDGSIPATLIINNKLKMRKFNAKELGLDELNNMVSPFVTKN